MPNFQNIPAIQRYAKLPIVGYFFKKLQQYTISIYWFPGVTLGWHTTVYDCIMYKALNLGVLSICFERWAENKDFASSV